MSNDTTCRSCGRTVSEKSIQDGSHECDSSALLDRIEELEARVESVSRMQAGTLAVFYATAAMSTASQRGTAQDLNRLMAKCLDASPVSRPPWLDVCTGDAIGPIVMRIARIVEQIVEETE